MIQLFFGWIVILPSGEMPSGGTKRSERMMFNKAEKMMCGASGLGIACGGALSLDGVTRSSDLQSNATQGCGRKMNTMKKLMFAATAALCATVGFADITSANIVG